MNSLENSLKKAPTVSLQLVNIHKSFGNKKIHRGVSLDLQKGEVVALLGGSGTGKSLILRSIIALEKPDSGQILFQGQDITQLNEKELVEIRKKISYVFQNGALFDSLTVEENIAYPLEEHTTLSGQEIQMKVNEILELIDMHGSNHLLPSEISGGMQKRVGLARAIILDPEVILFDEPTAGLDPTNTKRLVANIQKLKQRGVTGIFVTHDIPAAFAVADRAAILFDGKIAVIDTIENIKTSDNPIVRAFISEMSDPETFSVN
jgi:phospholipid/cholesterol/gamma-HCH transport system ATP-binding protein